MNSSKTNAFFIGTRTPQISQKVKASKDREGKGDIHWSVKRIVTISVLPNQIALIKSRYCSGRTVAVGKISVIPTFGDKCHLWRLSIFAHTKCVTQRDSKKKMWTLICVSTGITCLVSAFSHSSVKLSLPLLTGFRPKLKRGGLEGGFSTIFGIADNRFGPTIHIPTLCIYPHKMCKLL